MRISDWSSDVCSSDLQWQAFVKPFIEQAWPRQVKFRTESASRGFAHLVEQSGDNFPDAVRTVLSLLRPVAHLDMIRSEERRVGKEWVCPCRSRGLRYQ